MKQSKKPTFSTDEMILAIAHCDTKQELKMVTGFIEEEKERYTICEFHDLTKRIELMRDYIDIMNA